MQDVEQIAGLPSAYALSLWLRDLGTSDAQIAKALDVAPEAIESFLRIAELKRARVPKQNNDRVDEPGVVVFVDGPDIDLVDDGAVLAELRGTTLHLVALRRPRVRARADWHDVARRVLGFKLDVNLVVATGTRTDALRTLVADRGPVTVLSNRRQPSKS